MNEGNIEFSCEVCGMEFSAPSNVLQGADEDLTCPVCLEPVSLGGPDSCDEDEDRDDDENSPE